MMTCGRGHSYGEGRAQEGDVMAPEKAGGSTRRRGGTGRGTTEPGEPAAGKDAAPGITLVDIDPWGALEKLWEQPDRRRACRRTQGRAEDRHADAGHEAQAAPLGPIVMSRGIPSIRRSRVAANPPLSTAPARVGRISPGGVPLSP